jgi:hypothetical protein
MMGFALFIDDRQRSVVNAEVHEDTKQGSVGILVREWIMHRFSAGSLDELGAQMGLSCP